MRETNTAVKTLEINPMISVTAKPRIGPVRGFAVTLIIGLISNVFTAVFVSRTMFELVLSRHRGHAAQPQALSI